MANMFHTILAMFRNQVRIYYVVFYHLKRSIQSSIHVAATDITQIKIKRCMNNHHVHVLLEKEEVIRELENASMPAETIRITFAGAIRKCGNPNHHLERFLETVLNSTKNLDRIEVLAAIDGDDDIEHYLRLKRKYGPRFRLRFFVSPVRYGYERLHVYDKMLMSLMAPESRMMCDYSDDAIITCPHWDEKLLAIDALYPDNIYFIQTRITDREKFLGDVSKEQFRLLWIFQTYGCHSYFPIVSKGILECAEKALEILPEADRADWSPFANAWITDCYADMIGTYLKAEGIDRVHELAMMEIRHGIHAQYQHDRDSNGMTASNRAFIKMLGMDTQNHLRHIAKTIAKAIKPALVSSG